MNARDMVLEEIFHKTELLNRINRAMYAAEKNNIEAKEISKKDMLELLNATAGDEEFYETDFEIVWCGYKCKLNYGATNHNAITDTIDGAIGEEEE